MNNGFMFLHRQLLDWEWFDNSQMVHIWVYLLLKANYQDENWHGIMIPRGSFVTSIGGISKDTRLSARTIRTCLDKLKLTGEVTIKTTNKYSIVTICKYDSYNVLQGDICKQPTSKPTSKPTNNRQTTDKQTTTDNNIYKDNKDIKEEDTNVSKKKSTDYPSDFESDWTLYDRKGSKKDSYEQWKKLTDEDKEKMRRHIPHYFQSNDRQYLKDFERYIKHRTFESPVYRQAKMLFDPQIIENHINGEYDPSGWLNYDDTFDAFRYFGREPKYDLRDGYTDDNRPDGARVVTQSTVYVWSSATKTWSITR